LKVKYWSVKITMLKEKILDINGFRELEDLIFGDVERINLKNVSGSLFSFIVVFLFEKLRDNVFVVVQDEEFGRKIADDINFIAGEDVVFEFIPDEDMLADDIDVMKLKLSFEIVRGRKIFLTTSKQIQGRIFVSKEINNVSFHLRVGGKVDYDEFVSYLISNGFEKEEIC
jgi:transcription-repair coupling factor (superfamily II helicase)